MTEEDKQDPDQDPHAPAGQQQQQQHEPSGEPNLDGNISDINNSKQEAGPQIPPPALSTRHCQAPSEGAALPASVAVRVRRDGGGEVMGARRGREAVVSPPPLPSRGSV